MNGSKKIPQIIVIISLELKPFEKIFHRALSQRFVIVIYSNGIRIRTHAVFAFLVETIHVDASKVELYKLVREKLVVMKREGLGGNVNFMFVTHSRTPCFGVSLTDKKNLSKTNKIVNKNI